MEIFTKIFDGDFRKRLLTKASKTDNATTRIIAGKLYGIHPNQLAWRIHLAAWLEFCKSAGGLDTDRISRLRLVNNWYAWNQVLNELRIPYFLARVYGMHIEYIKASQGQHTADIRATKEGISITVEIKTPGQEPPMPPEGSRWLGKDKRSITQALNAANKQFVHNEYNLLAIGMHLLEAPNVYIKNIKKKFDTFIIETLYSHEELAGPIGGSIGNSYTTFIPNGELQPNKHQDNKPRFTRIGAVLAFDDWPFITTKRKRRCRACHQYHCTIYHNPYAKKPIPYELFWGTRQLLFDEEALPYWKWANGTTYTFNGY